MIFNMRYHLLTLRLYKVFLSITGKVDDWKTIDSKFRRIVLFYAAISFEGIERMFYIEVYRLSCISSTLFQHIFNIRQFDYSILFSRCFWFLKRPLFCFIRDVLASIIHLSLFVYFCQYLLTFVVTKTRHTRELFPSLCRAIDTGFAFFHLICPSWL